MPVFETFSDIVPAYKFIVEIPRFGNFNFSAVEGLGMTHRTVEYLAGGDTLSRKLYIGTDYSDVTLRRGVTSSTQLWDFAHHPMKAIDTIGAAGITGDVAQKPDQYFQDIVIKQLDSAGITIRKWVLTSAWVVSYTLGDLNAERNELSIESIVLAHSGLVLEDPNVLNTISNIL